MPASERNPYEVPNTTGSQLSDRAWHRGIWSTVLFSVLLFYVAASQIWMPIVLGMFVVPIQATILVFTLVFRRHHEHAVRLRVIKIAVYGLTLFAALKFANATGESIRTQAQELVDACEAFERDHGRLPKTLSELVPDYRASIPELLARNWLSSGTSYFYVPPEENRPASLFYRLTPDFSRSYSFETRAWTPP